MSCCARRCRQPLSRTTTHAMDARDRCRRERDTLRRPDRMAGDRNAERPAGDDDADRPDRVPVCRSGCRSLAAFLKTARRSPLPALSNASSAASPRLRTFDYRHQLAPFALAEAARWLIDRFAGPIGFSSARECPETAHSRRWRSIAERPELSPELKFSVLRSRTSVSSALLRCFLRRLPVDGFPFSGRCP